MTPLIWHEGKRHTLTGQLYRTLGVGISLLVLAVDTGVGWVACIAPCVSFSGRISLAMPGMEGTSQMGSSDLELWRRNLARKLHWPDQKL